jgi:hypothetical protein
MPTVVLVIPPPPVFPMVPVVPPVVLVTPTVAPAVELVEPPVVPTRMPLPLLHPPAPTVMTNMDGTISFRKTEHTRFNMVPPVARETGAMDDLSTTGVVYY